MIDPHLLRSDLSGVANNLRRRRYTLDTTRWQQLEEKRKAAQTETERLRAARNDNSRQIGDLKRDGGDATALMRDMEDIKTRLAAESATLDAIQDDIRELSLDIPNLLHDSVPNGDSDADNREERRWQEPPIFDFEVRDHATLGENGGMMDFALATKLAAARFVVMRDSLARLHRALAQFMLDLHTSDHGYREMYMPYLANESVLTGTGQLPKFEADLFHAERDNLYLIPTAEVVLTNLVREVITDAAALPMKLVCHSPCFRREAGSYGRDTRGMLRQHQFDKVELVQITRPKQSYEALEEMTRHAETVLQRLELPYRVVSLCGGDIGFAAAKTYDIEVWLPGQNAYREISSCSNCEAFQARRMKARYRRPDRNTDYVHTLNGSGVAVGRALIAVMENHQQQDGSIAVPDALRPYMGGIDRIAAAQP